MDSVQWPHGQEVRLAALDHVEAERAASTAAPDGVAARDEGLELPCGLVEFGLAAEPFDHRAELVPGSALDRTVGGDDHLVADGVDRPGGAGDGGLGGERLPGRLQLGERVLYDSGLAARLAHLLGRDLVEDVHDEVLRLGVVVRAGRVAAQGLVQGRGEISGRVGRQCACRELRHVITGVRSLEGDSCCNQGDDSRSRHGRALPGYASVLQLRPPVGPWYGPVGGPEHGGWGAHYSDAGDSTQGRLQDAHTTTTLHS